MKIEAIPLQFHPACQFDQLRLTPLQSQYLLFLRNRKSIHDLIQSNLNLGWLVNFNELYNLIEILATNHWILNQEIKDYFSNIQMQTSKPVHNMPLTEQADSGSDFNLNALMNLPFFRSLDKQIAELMIKNAKRFKLSPDTYICKAGDNVRSLCVLLKGQAGVYKSNGNFKQLVALLDPPSVFGEAGFFLNEKRGADVITLKDSEVLMVPYQQELLDEYLNAEKINEIKLRFWVQHALLHSELFRNIPADCFDALTFSGQIKEVKQNTQLIKQGDMSNAVYIVVQGSMLVKKDDKNINILSQGAIFGEISFMITGGVRTASVISQKDSLVLEISRDNFYRLLSKNLYLAKELEKVAHLRMQVSSAASSKGKTD